MHRRGHVGIALLAFAPIASVLISDGKPALAVLSWFGIQTVEELPDMDLHISWLDHRGISHSLFAALVVGSVLGFSGWLLGTHVFDLLLAVLSVGAGSLGWVLGLFPEVVGELFNALTPNLTPRGIVSDVQQAVGGVNRWAVALFGFGVGVFGILVHLLGDVITTAGIKPFLPVSSRQVSLSSLRSKSPTANSVLFGLGVVAIALVVLAAAPAGLSPVDVAAGQSANETNTTNATVAFANQTSNGSNVTIESATLPKGGFIAIHTGAYVNQGAPGDTTAIAVSEYLESGNYTNVTVEVSNAPPGNSPGLNRSQLNNSQTLGATAYRDTNDNQRFDYVQSFGENDTAYTADGSVVSDAAGITVPSPERPQSSVTFRNQTIEAGSNVVTVENATLPDGGYIVIHNDSYLPPESAPLESAVGITAYLEPGNYSNVEVPLVNGSVTDDQTLVAVPYRDTNGNQRYDYVASDGFQDVAYENRTSNQSIIVNDTAAVLVESTETDTGGDGAGMGDTEIANTSTPFHVTNLLVSNQSVHVGNEVTVTARVENPSENRLESDLALATAGEIVETQQVALFPRESQAVTFTHSYDAAGNYVIKVANYTRRIRVAGEGTPLTPITTTATNADSNTNPNSSNEQATEGESSGSLSLTDIILLVVLVSVLAGLAWALIMRRKRM